MKYDWQKICDGFAKELKEFLKKNKYEKFSLYECTFYDGEDANAKFLIAFCKHYNIPLDTGIISKTFNLKDGDCNFSDHNIDSTMVESIYATICPIIRNQFFIKNFLKVEYLLSTISPLAWLFESDIKEMAKIIDYSYVPFAHYAGGLTGDQLEWVEIQDLNYKVITGETDPSKNPRWLGYTADQRALVAKVYSLCLENKNNFQSCAEIADLKFKYQ